MLITSLIMSIQVSLLSRAFFLCFCWNLLLFLPPSFIRFFVVGVQAFSCFSYYIRVGKLDSLLHLQPIVNEAFEDLSVQLPTNVDSKMVGVSHTISIQWPIGEIINTKFMEPQRLESQGYYLEESAPKVAIFVD